MQPLFIGDVQGCAVELGELLDRGSREFGQNLELWIVGDLINRGPRNTQALERVREFIDAGRGHYVLGNHELSLLGVALGTREMGPLDTFGEILDGPDAGEWVEWLRRRPIAVEGRLGGQPFLMVHASVHPEWNIEEALRYAGRIEKRLGNADLDVTRDFLHSANAEHPDRDRLGRMTRCRSVSPSGEWSSQEPDAARVPWHRAWRAHKHRYGIVYGHWATQGLHCAPGLRGLDSGCVHHGRGRDTTLTAWLPDPDDGDAFAIPDKNFWQVPAKRAYWAEIRKDGEGA